ncbi:MAG: hypothetical protein A2Z72_05245 [Omnitrophica bacterium RBG_13_46_9]|nr:MAG: hypothetical protein A2Z72_05245 [Omnitrophica bacterium RBG_13_46_9]
MYIKLRSILVITVSSLIIASVLALTIFGFYAYLEWKEENGRGNYRRALYELSGNLFSKYILINLKARIDKEGIFKNRPVIEGTIKNTSSKKIYSLKLKIVFSDTQRHVVYVDTFYPIGLEFDSLANIGEIAKETKNFLLEGDSISFKHRLKNCPPQISEYLKSKLNFAKVGRAAPLQLEYKIEGVDIR